MILARLSKTMKRVDLLSIQYTTQIIASDNRPPQLRCNGSGDSRRAAVQTTNELALPEFALLTKLEATVPAGLSAQCRLIAEREDRRTGSR